MAQTAKIVCCTGAQENFIKLSLEEVDDIEVPAQDWQEKFAELVGDLQAKLDAPKVYTAEEIYDSLTKLGALSMKLACQLEYAIRRQLNEPSASAASASQRRAS